MPRSACVPSFLGASPIFALILLVGYVYGPRFGFVMRASLSLLSRQPSRLNRSLASVPEFVRRLGRCSFGLVAKVEVGPSRALTAVALGAVTGLAYRASMNLYSWPIPPPPA